MSKVKIVAKNRSGNINILLQYVIDRVPYTKSVGISVPEKYWEDEKVNKAHPQASEWNKQIQNVLLQTKASIERRKLLGIEPDKTNWHIIDFIDEKGRPQKKYSELEFLSFMSSEILEQKNKVTTGTIRGYNVVYGRLKKFWTKPFLYWESTVDFKWLEDFEQYLFFKEELKPNTIKFTMKTIRKFNNRAIRLGLTSNYPFSIYQVGVMTSTPKYLHKVDYNKLKALYETKDLAPNLQNILRAFLFSCNTGVAFSDLYDFEKSKHLIHNYFIKSRQKTQKPIRVPLSKFALELIEDIEETFKLLTNQKTNEYLKKIAVKAKVNQTVTFHMARHTFATLALNAGVDLKTVGELLSHSSVKTTEIYAQVIDLKREQAIDVLNNL